jgi:indoleamine 2,3-dioxygenase
VRELRGDRLEGFHFMDKSFLEHGFLPPSDPLRELPRDSPLGVLDEIGHDLPSLLQDSSFRERARRFVIPAWTEPDDPAAVVPQMRLCYLRLGFLASAYINQVGEPPVSVLPRNLALPLCDVCRRLGRPSILSYDGYALYNWKRLDAAGPIALGNIDTIQNFVHLYDEHWFILVHVEIEQIAAQLLAGVDQAVRGVAANDASAVNQGLRKVGESVRQQIAVLRRIPEKMDPALYYKTFRPYIRFFEHVIFEGVDTKPMDYRGETGAQSSIMPTLVALMKIPHRPSLLTNHLDDMQNFMPREHRQLIAHVQSQGDVRPLADKDLYNEVLEAMAVFREVHYGWAEEYINRRVSDPRGTGGTPYMQWLGQLISETRAHKIR